MKSCLTTGGWDPGDSLSFSLPQWLLWLETDSLTSGIMSSGEKCAEGLPRAAPHGAPALGGFACLHRRGHTPYCKSRMNYQRTSEDKVQSLPRLRKSNFKVCRRSGYSSCAKKLVHRTDGEPVYLRLRFLVLLGLGKEQGTHS